MSLRVPDRVSNEPIRAFREWWLRRDTGELESLVYPTRWPMRKPLIAACGLKSPMINEDISCDFSPSLDCSCGVFAYKGPEEPDTWLEERSTILGTWKSALSNSEEEAKMFMDKLNKVPVIGQVSLWGSVISHTLGYRAAKAYPYSLFVPKWAEDAASTLRSNYGVDVEEI